jgi:photosystem II stability/assembly factor-like uncharacterized protein
MRLFLRNILCCSVLLGSAIAAQAASSVSPALYEDLHWRQLGPFRGGWASCVAGIADQPDTFYIGTAGGGIWRTRNDGRTWSPLTDTQPFSTIGALAIAPNNAQVLYAGTGQVEPRYDIATGNGLYKSDDGGEHWHPAGLETTQVISAIHVDPRDANTLVVAALGHWFAPNPERGLYRSSDGGTSWQQVLAIDQNTGAVELAADPANPDVLYAASWQARVWPWLSYFTPVIGNGSAIYKSTDNGATWTKLGGNGWPAGALGRIGLTATHLADPAGGAGNTRLYATVDSDDNGGVWRSDDGGANWQRVNDDADTFGNWYFSRLIAAPGDADSVYAMGQSIRVSHDAGKTWTEVRGAPGGDDFHALWINPQHPDHWIAGSDQGAIVSIDNGRSFGSWYNQPTGQFYHLAADNRFPYWIYSGQQDSGSIGVASRSDYGEVGARDWHPVGGDERDYMLPDPQNPSLIYGSGLGGRVSRYDARTGQVANIAPWPVSTYGKDPRTVKYRYGWVTPIAISPAGNHALYLGSQLLFRSEDHGQTWKIISPDVTGTQDKAPRCTGDVAIADARACGYGVIASIAPSPKDANEIWTGSDSGVLQVTHDGGLHWSDVTPKSLPAWAKITSIDLSALVDGTVYIAADNRRQDDSAPHVWRSTDGGASWHDISAGLPKTQAVHVLRADPQRRGLLFAGTDAGVFASFDDGAHWSSLQLNLPTAMVNDLLIHGDDLIAGTQGRAIWVLDDIATLRQLAPGLSGRSLILFTPADALRWHANNNRDTPLPAEEPQALNPPAGAVIDYWLGSDVEAPVSIEILDSQRQRVRRFSSDDPASSIEGERYFSEDWLAPRKNPSATPGMHRFVWNLRYAPPRAASYDYSIAAVHGVDTPLDPQGAFVAPGRYEVILHAGHQIARALLIVKPDPRISMSDADYTAQLKYSRSVSAALAQSWQGRAEQKAVTDQLKALTDHLAGDASQQALQHDVQSVRDSLEAPDKKAANREPDFAAINKQLSSLASDSEDADGAPTDAQQQLLLMLDSQLRAAQTRWQSLRDRDLATLNQHLQASSQKAVTVPPLDQLHPPPEDGGKDLP